MNDRFRHGLISDMKDPCAAAGGLGGGFPRGGRRFRLHGREVVQAKLYLGKITSLGCTVRALLPYPCLTQDPGWPKKGAGIIAQLSRRQIEDQARLDDLVPPPTARGISFRSGGSWQLGAWTGMQRGKCC